MNNKHKELERLLSCHPQLRAILEGEVLDLYDDRFTPEWDQVLSLLNSTTVKALYLTFCLKSDIIRHIKHIQFKQLQYIDLCNNNISSMEHLQCLQAPLIRTLLLSDNRLTRVRSLSRCQFPHLVKLYLDRNPLQDIQSLTEIQAGIDVLWLYFGDEMMGEYMAWASKLPLLKQLFIQAPKQMVRGRVMEMLKVMSPQLEVEASMNW